MPIKKQYIVIIISIVVIIIALPLSLYLYKNTEQENYDSEEIPIHKKNLYKNIDVDENQYYPETFKRYEANTTPYDLDTTDPVVYTYQLSAPRIIKKDKLDIYADKFRGNIDIKKYPEIPIIGKSQFGSKVNTMGYFSKAFNNRYDRLTNLPSYISEGGTIIGQ